MADDRLTGLELQVRKLVKYWTPRAILKEMAKEFERTKDETSHEDDMIQMELAAAHMREDSRNFS